MQAQQHGADLKSEDDKRSYELKTSVCTTRKPKVNFNWPLPSTNKSEAERRKIAVKSALEKTAGGEAILRIVDGKRALIKEYRFCSEYIVGYFSRVPLGACGNHNMGCPRCETCNSFHRLDRMKYVDEQVRAAKERGEDLALVDWEQALYRSKCSRDRK